MNKRIKAKGFTLLEVMIVIALIGIIVAMVQFSFSANKPEDKLKEHSFRFKVIFESAQEYGLLNNLELGLLVKKNSYQFLAYDGVKWSLPAEQNWLAEQIMPEEVELVLNLDDLPLDEPILLDTEALFEDEEDFSLDTEKDKEKKLIPQVVILSGGDLTPFSLTFQLSESLDFERNFNIDDQELGYRVTGLYSTPLTITGPLLDED
jgi:general secretion pathway protein H|tara:strand:+ start:1126 stop:1743 length:618 start_codon:yes stop_codon:yes gene_type:complete